MTAVTRPADPGAHPDVLRDRLRTAEDLCRQGKLKDALAALESFRRDELGSLDAEALGRRAAALEDALRKRRQLRRNRVGLLALTVATGSVLLVLFAVDVRSVEIEADIGARRVQLQSTSTLRLQPVSAGAVSLHGLSGLRVSGAAFEITTGERPGSPAPARPARWRKLGLEDLDVELVPSSEPFTIGLAGEALQLQRVSFLPKTMIELAAPWKDKGLLVRPIAGGAEGEIQLGRTLELYSVGSRWPAAPETASGASYRLRFHPTSSLTFESAQGGVFEVAGVGQIGNSLLGPGDVDATAIAFLEDAGLTKVSAVTGGQVRFQTMARPPIDLRQGDALALEADGAFRVKQVALGPELSIRIAGPARLLRYNHVSQVPSVFEFLRANRRGVLYAGALLSVVSFIWLNLRRFEVIRA